jgi:ABC-type multidrug transport system fused ATPase/permease subunit
MEELEIKSVSDASTEKNEDNIKNESSLEIIGKNKKVNILSVLNENNHPLKSTKIPFKKLERSDKEDIDHKTKIVYPANFFNSLSFNWLYDVIKNRTEDNPVKLSSLNEISPTVQSKHFYDEIMINWYGKYNKKVKSKSTGYPLFMTLLSTNTRRIFISLILFFIRFISEFFFVLSFKDIITRFNQNKKRHKTILSSLSLIELIIFMLINKCIGLVSSRQIVFYVENLGKFSTVQLNCLIYDKLLKLACYNKGTFTEGQIVNLIQTDSEKFGIFIATSPEVIILPFKLIYSVYILFSFFHESFVIGFICLIIMIYLFFVFGSKEKKYQRQMMKAADLRMNLTTQVFNIIKTIKLYVWENVFLQKIQEKRNVELDFMKKKLRMQIWSNFTYWIADVVLYSVSIVFYNLIHNQMDTTKIITGIYIVNDLVIPMFNLPHFIRFYFETIISLVRIETFLSYKENEDRQIKYLPKDSEYAVIIENVDFGVENKIDDKSNNFNKKEEEIIKLKVQTNENNQKMKNNIFDDSSILSNQNNKIKSEEKIITLLKGINFKIKKGEHIGIIGEVGSGKTCLLNSIINNLAVLNKKESEGNIQLSGKVSFVSQNSWILNDTIEQNILFFKPMDREKYNKVISICQLTPDLLIFPQGDQTEIGEKGVNLSGGQKARMAIARAVYNDSDIYVFDDPLSALDAYVGMNLFNEVFNDYLKDKTIIISTHALQYVSNFDRIFYIHQGEIKFSGEPKEIENQQFYQEFKSAKENKKNDKKEEEEEDDEKKEKKK